MSASWGTLAARAAGLRARLLGPDALDHIGSVETTAELGRILEGTRFARYLGGETRPEAVERAVDRVHADELETLARWSSSGADLGPIFLVIDAHNVRAILRGMAGGLGAQPRLAGAVGTPTLGRRTLERLARTDSARAVVAVLVARGHPLGTALAPEATRATPDLFRIERALADATSGSVGDRPGGAVRDFMADLIDEWNVSTAVLLVGSRSESPTERLYVAGGRAFGLSDFVAATRTSGRLACVEVIARATRGTPIAIALADAPPRLAGISERILDARIRALRRALACSPLTATSPLLLVLQIEREARAVRRALWRARFREARAA